MPRVYVTSNEVPQQALDILSGIAEVRVNPESGSPSRATLLREVRDVDGLFCLLTEKIDDELLAAGGKLKIVASMAVGFDHIDLSAATKRGVMATNTPGVLTEAVADLTFGLILAIARRVVEGDGYVRHGSWRLKWSPMMMVGTDVHGKTLGIYGLGRIGMAVAKRASGFGMKIIYHSSTRKEGLEEEFGVEYRSKEDLLRESDFFSVHVPLNGETRKSIGEGEIGIMKRTAYIVNTSRGGIVDEKALIRALDDKKIAGAALDVFEREPVDVDNPLLKMENVIVEPHIASGSIESRTAMAVLAAQNLVEGLSGVRPRNLLNAETFKGQ